jgi:hypothetical protein
MRGHDGVSSFGCKVLAGFLLFASLWTAGCGGGGGSGGGSATGGGLSVNALWEQPDGGNGSGAQSAAQQAGGGFGPDLPASVVTVRFLFRSSGGTNCCLAVDPDAVPTDPETGQRLLTLASLPAGPGTLTITGFPTDFAPNDGVLDRCETNPAGVGAFCDAGQTQSPSFASDPKAVNIVAGAQNDAGDIEIPAVPFVLPGSLSPAPGTDASNPIEARAIVVDAVTGIEESSVALQVQRNGAPVAPWA